MKTIVLQLKSTQRNSDLGDISSIIKSIYDKYNYKLKGHEIQQLDHIIKKTTMRERVDMVSAFCSLNELDYLTYHTRIFENGENIWDEKWNMQIRNSILLTIKEVEKVQYEVGMKNKAVIVFHLTNFVPRVSLPRFTREEKFQMMEKAEHAFLKMVFSDDLDNDEQVGNSVKDYYSYTEGITEEMGNLEKSVAFPLSNIILAVENSYPKLYRNYAITSPFHPIEIARLAKYGIKTVFDLSHYHLYSTYLLSGSGNLNGDLDRQIYGRNAPDWKEVADILADSIVQLHISDARGFTSQGEGLRLGEGQIDLQYALTSFDEAIRNKKKMAGEDSSSLLSILRGTIELNNGHLDHSKIQQNSAEWLLENIPQLLF